MDSFRPLVRFAGFEGEWERVRLGELFERSSEKNDLTFGTDKIISVANMYFLKNERNVQDDYLRTYNVMRLGDIAFEGNKSKNFAHGRFVENTIGDGIVSHVFVVLKRANGDYDLNFWKYYINDENVMGSILTRSTKSSTMMNDIVVDDFLKESILVPSYEEQKVIGVFLTKLDEAITLQTQKLSKLKQIKAASLQNMFPQEGHNVPAIRFQGFRGEWKCVKLNSFAKRITRKNANLESTLALTIASAHGLVSQMDYFNNLVVGSNIYNYYLIKKGEFAYNKSSSSGYPFGSVKRLDFYEKGILSTLYIVFDIDETVSSDYVVHYFDSSLWHSEIAKVATEGARNHGLLNIGAEDFLNIHISLPSLPEQQAIANYFTQLDRQITLQTQKLEKLKQIKAACLSKMFV